MIIGFKPDTRRGLLNLGFNFCICRRRAEETGGAFPLRIKTFQVLGKHCKISWSINVDCHPKKGQKKNT